MLQIGSIIDGKYKILNKIGQGGMSIVYLAMNERANKQWAIKEVRLDSVQDFGVIKQGLLAETDLLKKLKHPNLPSIVDVIDGEGSLLIVMDYIEGKSLGSILKGYGAQSQKDVIDWARQICGVLGYLHSRQPPVIYRDMKPDNIMLRQDGRIMLIDFGTAREFKDNVAADTVCLGTRGYAAPEQYGGRGQTDARTDIYCLGATMYHLLTGHDPGEPPYEMYPIRYWNPDLSSGLEEIVRKCTQYNPEDRYQSCGELMDALEHYYQLDIEFRKVQRRKWKAFLAMLSLTVIFGAGAAGFRAAENTVASRSYNVCLEEAASLATTDPEASVEYYIAAIHLDPACGKAYRELLNFFLWKKNDMQDSGQGNTENVETVCIFDSEEEQKIRRVLGINGDSGRRNEEYLKTNTDDYNRFAYDLGIAYFYSYRGVGNKAAALKWLEIASGAEPTEQLSERNIQRAKNLCRIAGYYDSLGIRNQAGDSMASFSDYWYDLADMVRQEAEHDDNNVNMLLIFKEAVAQIFSKGVEFKNAGITREQMKEILGQIIQSLEQMEIHTGTANAEYEEELRRTVQGNAVLAGKNLKAVFNTENIGQKGGGDAAGSAEN